MSKWDAKHWAILLGLFGSVAVQLSSVHNWSETVTPAFVSGLIGTMVTTITGLLVGKPGAEQELREAKWGPRPVGKPPAGVFEDD